MTPKQQPCVLIAEDEPNDAILLRYALERCNISAQIQIVSNGAEVMDYFKREGKFADQGLFSFPTIMFLDLKMPGMNGFDVLEWVKHHPEFRVIPTIILSASAQDRDIWSAYALGANSYMVKPCLFEDLATLVKLAFDYWSSCAIPALPHEEVSRIATQSPSR